MTNRTSPPEPREQDAVTREELDKKLVEGRTIMSNHIDTKFAEVTTLIKSGFPDNDPRKHRELHEALIEEAADRRELWKSVREKTVTGAVYSGLIFIGLAIWEAIKTGVLK